ncbi:MAG: SH3 domain-containing protein [Candidatus Pelethousia sp.]|nr:SH3 domain-containing protein [Candidatus Pelethousia sp.]
MKKHMRSLALLLAVIFALGCVSLAQADLTNGSIVTTITNATVYLPDTSSATGTTMKATGSMIPAGTQLTVYGTNGTTWIAIQVKDSASGTPYVAWIQAKDVTAGASGTTTGTATGTATGTPGTIVNCSSGVNMRSGAGKSNSSIMGVPKGAAVSVLSSEKGSDGKTWYKVTYGTTTGYIRSDYVSTTGTVSSGTGTGTTNTSTDSSGTTMVSLDNIIYMRKTATSSTSGATKLTGVKGKPFTILGESGSFYYASYGSNKGYVRKQDFSTGSSGSTTGTAMTYAAVTGTSADQWGYIKQIPGTKIGSDFGKLYDNYIYCNGLNAKKTDYYYNAYSGNKNYFFSIAPKGVETAVISGHNMQQSQTGFHDLHHVQNALRGVTTCEESSCRANCSGSGGTTFYINYDGKTTWQVVGFFEINQDTVASEATRKNIQSSTLLNFTLTGAQKQAWINQVMGYANATYKGKTISTATSEDKLMVLYTCGDHGNAGARASANGAGSSKGGYQNLYFVLKAVG